MNAQEKKDQSIVFKVRDYLTVIITVGTVISMVMSALNLLMLNRIQPLDYAIQALNKQVIAVNEEHKTFINKDLFIEYEKKSETRDNDIIHRIDFLSNRLDKVIIK